jgi:spore germination protein PC
VLQNGMPCPQMFQQVYAHLNWQTQRIEKLEQQVSRLQADLDAMKEHIQGQKQIHIDKIEYKFDQLKIERLDGSLSIGVNPGTFDDIEDFSVNGAAVGAKAMQGTPVSTMQQDISGCIQGYLNYDAKEDLRKAADKLQYPLEESYEELILEDIRGQVESRIEHYIKQYRSAGFKDNLDSTRENIIQQTKRDIQTAIETYISHLSSKEGEQS